MLVLEEGHCLGEQALRICRVARAAERLDFRGTSLAMLVEMVAGGLGVTIVPGVAVSGGLLPASRVASAPAQSSHRLLASTMRSVMARAQP